jgi:hypothetical protein
MTDDRTRPDRCHSADRHADPAADRDRHERSEGASDRRQPDPRDSSPGAPDIAFVHFGGVNDAGHDSGPLFALYQRRIEAVDAIVRRLLAAVRRRTTYAREHCVRRPEILGITPDPAWSFEGSSLPDD